MAESPQTLPVLPQPSRRTLLQSLLGAGILRGTLPRLFAASAAMPAAVPVILPLDRLLQEHTLEGSHATERRYRAHAYVHILAIPVFSRQDVGGGYAVVEEAQSGSQSIVGLQFAGGSTPERTRGLNRVGFIQEAVLRENGLAAESAYYGFMVASGEKNLDQARRSMQSDAHQSDTNAAIPYAAANGQGRAGRFQCTISHLMVPARFNWHLFGELSRDMRARVAVAPAASVDIPLDTAASRPDTFLYSMRRAILSPDTHTSCPIVYNGKRFILATQKQPDPKVGHDIWRLNGSTTETATRQASNFQLWYAKGDPSGLPVRIEFYPKSFLKLVFEQDAGTDGPKVALMLNSVNGTRAVVAENR